MSRLGDKVDECITDAKDLSKRIGLNFARICDHREEAGNARGLLSNKINAVSERLDETSESLEEGLEQGDADYQNLDSRIKALEGKCPNPVAQLVVLQDGNKRLLDANDSLRADNEKLRVQLGVLERCNSDQAKRFQKLSDLARRVQYNLPFRLFTDEQKELFKEINDELS
jgi:regulator of replication initiation timing